MSLWIILYKIFLAQDYIYSLLKDKAYSPSVSSLLKFQRVKPRVVRRPWSLQRNENQ